MSALLNFVGKVALVTGASRGIGHSIVLALLHHGVDKVYAVATHPFQLQGEDQKNLQLVECVSKRVVNIICDLRDWDSTEAKINLIDDMIDLLVNNAAISVLEELPNVKKSSMEDLWRVNVMAPLNIAQIVASRLIHNSRGGAIVNVSSISSQQVFYAHTAYCATKAALDSLTRSMALEFGPHNIRVNSVNPTVVLTELGKLAWSEHEKARKMLDRHPLGKFAECEHVANAVLFLLSDAATMTTGCCLPVDGGMWIA